MGQRINWAVDGTLIYARTSTNVVSSALVQLDMDYLDDIAGTFTSVPLTTRLASAIGVVFNFPAPVLIDKVGMYMGSTNTMTVDYSLTATSPATATGWLTLVNAQSYGVANAYQEFPIAAPVATQWLRVWGSSTIANFYQLVLFGTYSTPRFEFWSNDGTPVLFTENYPLAFPTIPNDADSGNITKQFRLKNTHLNTTHSYSLEIQAVKQGGETTITNYLTIDTPTISNLAYNSLSNPVTITANFPALNNPADGYHFFKILVTETA